MDLDPIAPDLWTAEGPTVRFLGVFPYPTRMAVARLRDGGLWVWTPTELTDALASELEALGRVAHLVAPNKLHHLFLPAWVAAHPDAKLHGAPGLARKRPDLHFDGELTGRAPDAWAEEIDQALFTGSMLLDEVVFFHRASRTALVTDLIQRFDPKTLPPLSGIGMRMDGIVGEHGSTPRDWRALWWNRKQAREARRRVLDWKPERLVVAHGECVREGATPVIERALAWMGRD